MLIELLERSAAARPEGVAIVHGGHRISYSELAARVHGFAARLEGADLGESPRIGLVLPNTPAFVVAFFGIARVGGVGVPLNPALSAAEIARYLAHLGVRALIAPPGLAAQVGEASPGLRLLPLPDETTTRDPDASREVHDGDVVIQASSGSTGLAKWICRTHANLVAEAEGFAELAGMSDRDVVLGAPPLFHSHGMMNGMVATVRAAATLVLLDRPDDLDAPDPPFALRCGHVLELLERERVSVFPGVPFMFDALAVTGRRGPPELPALRLCFSAGNALPEKTYRRFVDAFGLQLRQLYGCSEAGAISLDAAPADKVDWRSVGHPLPGMEIRARDGGELEIRSAAVGRTLDEEASADRDWLRTGDLGRVDAAGRVVITGRTKLFIDSGGQKVDPVEIEDVLASHPDVEEAAVVGVPVPGRGEEIRAFVVPRRPVEPAILAEHCRAQLAGFKRPRRIEIRGALPRSPLGKLLRGQLLAPPPSDSR